MTKKLYLLEYCKGNTYRNKIVKADSYETAIKKARLKEIEEIKEISTEFFTNEQIKILNLRFQKEQSLKQEIKTGSVTL